MLFMPDISMFHFGNGLVICHHCSIIGTPKCRATIKLLPDLRLTYPDQPGRSGMLFMPDISMFHFGNGLVICRHRSIIGHHMSGNDKTVARPTLDYA